MDLRMVKTRAQIKAAFLKLREKCMPDKIKVKDICEMAMINKTTFYNHYADSAQLSDEIDNNAIDRVISDFPDRDKLFEDPKACILGLFRALEGEADYLKIVFRGKQDVLCSKLEERFRSIYNSIRRDDRDNMKLSFAIGGFTRIIKDYLFSENKCDIQQLTDTTIRMMEALFKQDRLQSAATP